MEVMDEEIRNAMEVEIGKLTAEEEVQKKKLMEEEEIRNIRLKSVLHISPVEIIYHGDKDFINVVARNINQIELVIHIIYHYYIKQYWGRRSGAATTDSSSISSLCQHHDYLHPRDDDDEEMTLASCEPLLDPPIRFKIIIDQGAFASDHDHDHIMSTTLLRGLDILFEYDILSTYELEDLKRSITRRISEAKAHVLRAKPKRVRICIDVGNVTKNYFGSPEVAIYVAAKNAVGLDAVTARLIDYDEFDPLDYYPTIRTGPNVFFAKIKRASRLSREALEIKTFEKEDLIFMASAASPSKGGGRSSSSTSSSAADLHSSSSSSSINSSNSNSNSRVVVDDQYSSSISYSCPVCLKELRMGVDIINKMPCSHVFHCFCLTEWLKQENTCPLCRFELPIWDLFFIASSYRSGIGRIQEQQQGYYLIQEQQQGYYLIQ